MCRNRGSRMRPSQAMFRCECDEQTGEQSLELMSMASYYPTRDESNDYLMSYDEDEGENDDDYQDELGWDDWEEWAMRWATHH